MPGALSPDAGTGCGSQRLRRPLSGPCILLATAPTDNSLFLPLAAVVAVAFHRPPYCLRQQGPTPADGPQRNSRRTGRKVVRSA